MTRLWQTYAVSAYGLTEAAAPGPHVHPCLMCILLSHRQSFLELSEVKTEWKASCFSLAGPWAQRLLLGKRVGDFVPTRSTGGVTAPRTVAVPSLSTLLGLRDSASRRTAAETISLRQETPRGRLGPYFWKQMRSGRGRGGSVCQRGNRPAHGAAPPLRHFRSKDTRRFRLF